MSRLVALWLLVGMFGACGGAREQTRPTPSVSDGAVTLGGGRWQLPAEVGRAVESERLDLPAQELELVDVESSPKVTITAVGRPDLWPSPRKGIAYFRAVLDLGVSAECVVRSDRLDVAQAFRNAYAQMVSNPALGIRHMGKVQQVSVDGWPVLFLPVEYLTPSRQYGSVHMAATNVNDHGLFCSLDSPGYTRTFSRLVEELTRSLRNAVPDKSARRSFHWVEIDGDWTGMVENVERVRPDGVHVDMSFASLLSPELAELRVADEVNVEITEADGALVLWRTVREEDGQMRRDLVLAPTANRHVSLRGTERDAQHDEDLGANLPSTGRDLRGHYVTALKDGQGGPHVFLRYYPGVDVKSLAEETVELVEQDADKASFRSVIRTPRQQVESQYVISPDGELLQSVITAGGVKVKLVRVDR